jgi:Rod binding domain-containing protein
MSIGPAARPPIDAAQLPADIRTAAPARRNAYAAGLGFERLLVQQLTQSFADSARDALGGDSPYASLLPDAMTDGLMSGGGLGLARQLTDAIAPAQASPADRAGGGEDARAAAEGERARARSRQDPPAAAPEPTA